MATVLKTGQVDVGETAVPLSSVALEVGAFMVRAHPNNAAVVEFGEAGVTLGTGYPLMPGETFLFEFSTMAGTAAYDRQPQDVYVVGTTGDKVAFVAAGKP